MSLPPPGLVVRRLQERTGPESWGRVRGPLLQARLILQDGCDQVGVGDIFSQGSGWEQWGTEHPLGSKLALSGRPGTPQALATGPSPWGV